MGITLAARRLGVSRAAVYHRLRRKAEIQESVKTLTAGLRKSGGVDVPRKPPAGNQRPRSCRRPRPAADFRTGFGVVSRPKDAVKKSPQRTSRRRNVLAGSDLRHRRRPRRATGPVGSNSAVAASLRDADYPPRSVGPARSVGRTPSVGPAWSLPPDSGEGPAEATVQPIPTGRGRQAPVCLPPPCGLSAAPVLTRRLKNRVARGYPDPAIRYEQPMLFPQLWQR